MERVSIPFFTETWRPDSFYDKIRKIAGLDCILSAAYLAINFHHKLIFNVDIHMKEPTLESLCSGRTQYEPPRYMSINTAI
ncbi:hypothetical protein CerSpe_055270 [Prunus speciosa]